MSSVLQPRGPLPPRVYWTRRVLLLTVIVMLTGVVGMAVARGGNGSDPAGSDGAASQGGSATSDPGVAVEDDDPTPSAAPTSGATQTPDAEAGPGGDRGTAPDGDPGSDRPDANDDSPSNDAPPGEDRAESADPTTGGQPGDEPDDAGSAQPDPRPLPLPTGPCDPAEVDLTVEVADSPAGKPNPVVLAFESASVAACTLGITPEVLEVRVVTGDLAVWASTDCPAQLAARQLVVRRGAATTYNLVWTGHVGTDDCRTGEPADPGGYWVQASLVGGEPTEAYFAVT